MGSLASTDRGGIATGYDDKCQMAPIEFDGRL